MRSNISLDDLTAIARRVGVSVVVAPSSHRGRKGTMGSVRGVTCHHTGTPNSFKPSSDYPDFNVVKEGRAGLANSLSAYGIGRHTAIYVFSEYLSWHAGTWNYRGFTDGNGDFLGIECAGVSDFTSWQRKVYPRLVAAILLFIGESVDMAPRHADGAMPRGRKTDASFTGTFHEGRGFYDSVRYFMQHPEYINVNYSAPKEPKAIEEDTVLYIANVTGDSGVYVGDGITRRHIPDPTQLEDLIWHAERHGVKIVKVGNTARIEWLGIDITHRND